MPLSDITVQEKAKPLNAIVKVPDHERIYGKFQVQGATIS